MSPKDHVLEYLFIVCGTTGKRWIFGDEGPSGKNLVYYGYLLEENIWIFAIPLLSGHSQV